MQRALIDFFDLDSDFAQPGDYAHAMLGLTISNLQFAFSDRGSHDERSGFDPIGNNRVRRHADD